MNGREAIERAARLSREALRAERNGNQRKAERLREQAAFAAQSAKASKVSK